MPYPYPPIPEDEAERLEEVNALRMLDTPPEEPFDGIAEITAALFKVPYAAISLIGADRQWYKASVGIPFASNTRELAFCSHTIMARETMVVEDFTQDERFVCHPHVTGEPRLRFYAGTPLISEAGQCVGTVCMLDVATRTFTREQCRLLERLARQTMDALEYRKLVGDLAEGLVSAR